jgi:NTE family protein
MPCPSLPRRLAIVAAVMLMPVLSATPATAQEPPALTTRGLATGPGEPALTLRATGTWREVPASSQDASPTPQEAVVRPTRRTIGLALSGGAARGLAHIGFLQWLDEHRIPVDMVAGTSMGALIGGAFAAGMPPADIRAFVEAADWSMMLSIDSPFTVKSFRRKQDARAFPTDVKLGLKHGFSLPGGLSAGPQIDLMLDQIALPYFDLRSFDDLPTRFRCVAADLRRSEVVVFDSGLLSRALRATMALPGVFTPVIIGDQVLVDGGVLNNVPADVTRRMGADVVIAVDVTRELVEKKRTESIVTVVGDTVRALVSIGTRKALESADLVVVVDLTGVELFDFSRSRETIKRGYDAAEKKHSALLPFAASEEEYASWKAARQARRRTSVPSPVFVKVEGVGRDEAAVILRRLRRYEGRPIDVPNLARDITALTGNDQYESISYRLIDDAGATGLLVTVKPKPYGPPFLLAATDLQNSEAFRLDATARVRVVAFDQLGSRSEIRLDAGAGTRLKLGAELYKPLLGTGIFIAPRGEVTYSHQNAFQGDSVRSEYRDGLAGAGVDLGVNTGLHAEARLGLDVQRVVRHINLGVPTLPNVDGTQQFASVRLAIDLQDDGVVPSRGLYARAEARQFFKGAWIEGSETPGAYREADRLRSAEIDASMFFPISTRGRLFVRGAGGSSFGERTVVNAFALGGPFRIGSINNDELRGSNFLLGNLGYLRQVARLAEGTLGAMYAGGWVDYGATFEQLGAATFRTCFNGGVIVRSPLGPVFLAASVDTTGRGRLSFGVGTLLHR